MTFGAALMHVYAQIYMHSQVPRFELNFLHKEKLKKNVLNDMTGNLSSIATETFLRRNINMLHNL